MLRARTQPFPRSELNVLKSGVVRRFPRYCYSRRPKNPTCVAAPSPRASLGRRTVCGRTEQRRPTVFKRYETNVRMVWGSFLIAAAALKTPTRNGYNAQGVNLTLPHPQPQARRDQIGRRGIPQGNRLGEVVRFPRYCYSRRLPHPQPQARRDQVGRRGIPQGHRPGTHGRGGARGSLQLGKPSSPLRSLRPRWARVRCALALTRYSFVYSGIVH